MILAAAPTLANPMLVFALIAGIIAAAGVIVAGVKLYDDEPYGAFLAITVTVAAVIITAICVALVHHAMWIDYRNSVAR